MVKIHCALTDHIEYQLLYLLIQVNLYLNPLPVLNYKRSQNAVKKKSRNLHSLGSIFDFNCSQKEVNVKFMIDSFVTSFLLLIFLEVPQSRKTYVVVLQLRSSCEYNGRTTKGLSFDFQPTAKLLQNDCILTSQFSRELPCFEFCLLHNFNIALKLRVVFLRTFEILQNRYQSISYLSPMSLQIMK